jgi:hypothetical protein
MLAGSIAYSKIAETAWTSYTPTWTNLTVGNATQEFYYMQIGKLVVLRGRITLGSTSSVSTNPRFTTPTTHFASSWVDGDAKLVDASGSTYLAAIDFFSNTTMRVGYWSTSGANLIRAQITSTVPFTWASTDAIEVVAFYETS